MRVRVVVNPEAGGGSARKKTSALAKELERAGLTAELVETSGPEHATHLAGRAFADRVDRLAVLGGDGTLSEVCEAYFRHRDQLECLPPLALFPSGTGCDFGRTLGLEVSIESGVASIVDGVVRSVDLGVVELTDHGGNRVRRAFANVMSFGLGGVTDRIVSRGPKWMGGRAAFFLGAVRALLAYRNLPVTVRVDGQDCLEAPIMNVAIANGCYFGGGMRIAPEADPGDGLLDVVAVYDLSRAQGLALARRIYRGTHPGCPGVRVARGRMVEASPVHPGDEVLIDLDGETPGRLPLRAWLLPQALRVCVPRRAPATRATGN